MVPAPSGLQEVDGLNHLLENPHLDRRFGPQCTAQSLRPSHCPNCSRSIPPPTGGDPRTASCYAETRPSGVRRPPFQPLPQPTDRSLRRYGYEKVHVVSGYVPLHNRDLVLRTDVADHVLYPRRHFPTQSWPPIFRYPDQMQMDLEYGMRAVSVVWHPSSLICSARAEAVASRRGLEPTQTVTVR